MQAIVSGNCPAEAKTNEIVQTPPKKGFLSFYTKGEEIFNAVSHIVGGAMGLAFWVVLAILAYPDAMALTGVSLFGFGVVTLYTMSTLYHFLPDGRAKGVFRVFDHCTIYLLIAGTYSPFLRGHILPSVSSHSAGRRWAGSCSPSSGCARSRVSS